MRAIMSVRAPFCVFLSAVVLRRCWLGSPTTQHRTEDQDVQQKEQLFLTLKKQMEAAAPLAPDGTLRVETSVPERTEYEQQIEAL